MFPIEKGREEERKGKREGGGEGDGMLKSASKRLINSLNKCVLNAYYVPATMLTQWEGCLGGCPPSDFNVLPTYSYPRWHKAKMATSEM